MTVVQERSVIDARLLIGAKLRQQLADDVRKKRTSISADLAARGVGQMVAFLIAGTSTHLPLSPSEIVDDFWHAFILRTEDYARFCEHMAGRFIHHRPEFLSRVEHGGATTVRQRTIDAIAGAGFLVDLELWPELDTADCHQCHAGCHDSPKSGKQA